MIKCELEAQVKEGRKWIMVRDFYGTERAAIKWFKKLLDDYWESKPEMRVVGKKFNI